MSDSTDTEKQNLANPQENDTLKKQLEEGQRALQKLMQDNQAKDKQLEDLTSRLTSATSKLEEYDAKLRDAQLEEAGVNPEQVKQLEQEIESRLEQKYQEQYGTEFSQLKKENQQLKDQLHNVTTVSGVMAKFATDAEESTRDILEAIVSKQIHQDPNDSSKTYATDEFGNKKLSKKFPGQPMEAEEFMEELRSQRAPLFKSKQVTQSVMRTGQKVGVQSSANTNIIDGVDVERFKTDVNYYNSFDRETRAKIATKIGI